MRDMQSHAMGRVKHIHFVGIGGAGMGGIAEVLKNIGYEVTGSDIKESAITKRLDSLGVCITIGHAAENIVNADVVVITSAIDEANEELCAARNNRVPVVRRAEMLAELMRFSQGIAIAGTHGKTTTTSLVASVLAEGGLDPTYIIGGLLNSSGSHARLGTGKYIVAEADESDASFLHLYPVISVITNIDADHLDTYAGDFANLRHNFVEFLHQLPFYGLAVLCIDDEGVRKILPEVTKPVVTYGMDFEADYNAELIKQESTKTWFKVSHKDNKNWLEVELNLPGKHNLLNALASIAIAHELGVSDKDIVSALSHFQGISRRCHVRGDIKLNNINVTLIDDYAHHPTEIEAIFDAIKAGWPERRLVVVYQPHRYTRLRDLFEDFSQILASVDCLIILNVYPAGEEPIAGADSRSLCRAIRLRGHVDPIFVEDKETVPEVLSSLLEENDLLLTLGAGDIGALSKQLYSSSVH
ncbi:MAG: UDP-N-acetylmuramate--L-alanine ligase [Proteobacteria bacterium]|nr:UDP-N-acetylmuramate--L-alanine ligase [Pseudomonadota bacterium]NOG60091.1 UDP-N-acetylmuramate--L-alanine ligase [Pseudomonadota bacterium]